MSFLECNIMETGWKNYLFVFEDEFFVRDCKLVEDLSIWLELFIGFLDVTFPNAVLESGECLVTSGL